MARNLKRDYIKKLVALQTSNGFKFDVTNYIYNPSYDHDYPHLTKVIAENETSKTIQTVKYFKYYNGGGEYITSTHTEPKEAENTWYVVKDKKESVIEASNRFSLSKLIKLAESI